MTLLLAGLAHASWLLGAAWAPVGTGALAWDDANRWSDTLSGEFDGLLRPPLAAHAGWIGGKDAVTGGLALVRFTDSTFSSNGGYVGVGGTRLAVDYRRYVWRRDPGAVGFYGTAGVYGILANARDVSDAYSEEEQNAADETSASLRSRIGGVGGQAGVGAADLFADRAGRPAVALGVRGAARLYRGQAATEDGYAVSTVILPEAALVVDFQR